MQQMLLGMVTVLAISTTVLAGSALRTYAEAQAPAALGDTTFTYQGRLTDSAGKPVTVAKNLRLRLYTPAGVLKHDSGTALVTPDASGLFTVVLGQAPFAALPSANLAQVSRIDVSVEGELMPSQALSSLAGYSFDGTAVRGFSLKSVGVHGIVGGNTSIVTVSEDNPKGLAGYATTGTGSEAIGTYGQSDESVGLGVVGAATGSSGTGVTGRATGTNSTGVYGSGSSTGVSGYSSAGTGVFARSDSATGAALHASGATYQTRDKGGLAKVLLRFDVTNFNGAACQLMTNGSNDGVTRNDCTGVSFAGSNGAYTVTVPFPVNDRFISLQLQNPTANTIGGSGSIAPVAALHSFPSSNQIAIRTVNAYSGAAITGIVHIVIY